MGRVNVDAWVTNSADVYAAKEGLHSASDVRQVQVTFLVDTGAAMVCLPMSTIRELGLQPKFERDANTANARVRPMVYSPMQVEVMGRAVDQNVMETPEETPPLLGYLALEALDLYPNPKKQVLEGNPEHDGKYIVDLF